MQDDDELIEKKIQRKKRGKRGEEGREFFIFCPSRSSVQIYIYQDEARRALPDHTIRIQDQTRTDRQTSGGKHNRETRKTELSTNFGRVPWFLKRCVSLGSIGLV